jgi:signal transduction histidine kinase
MNRSATVLLGFAGLLLFMGALVVDSSTQSRGIALDSAALRKEYLDRDALLDQFRTDVYHVSTLIRDYLLELHDAAAANQRSELEAIQGRSEVTLSRYGKTVQPSERESFRILHGRAELYWQALEPALHWNAANRQRLGEAFLRETVVPRRNELIRLVKQVNALDQRDTNAGEERIQALYWRFQRRVRDVSFLALVLGACLAIVVILHVQHLERESIRRFDEVQAAKRDLRLLSERLVTAQEEERRNLSCELHDDVGQSMSAMLMELGRLESRLGGAETSREILASVRQMAEYNVARVRDLSLLLRPFMLDELGLVPALRWQVREVSRRTGLKVKMIADEFDGDLSDAHRTCVYRIVQEALHNCVKHSRASEVHVVMNHDRDGLSVSIQDNGIGFDAMREKGLGLLGIEERVSRLGGRACVESHSGEGAVVCAHFPSLAGGAAGVEESVA